MIEFVRVRDYQHVKDLGEGATGKTILLYDDMLDEHFVCKKYHPHIEENRVALYESFVNEAKTLQKILHENIVRFYSCYLYPNNYTGYILLEYIEGDDIETFIENKPELINEVFKQVIKGFSYLENLNILHRDIRPQNILVDENDLVKIIDFGFSKKVIDPNGFDNSISLNWWCEPPSEFVDKIYNFATEVYFVGKLFEDIIVQNEITNFKYRSTLNKMINKDPGKRIDCFLSIEAELNQESFLEIEFNDYEREAYLEFSNTLHGTISKIQSGAKYETNADTIIRSLSEIYRNCMLEDYIPDNAPITRVFLGGAYYYNKNQYFYVNILKNFLELLLQSPKEKRNIILSNLQTKLNAIPRYNNERFEDDIPF